MDYAARMATTTPTRPAEEAVPLDNTVRHAYALLDCLVDHGPITSAGLCEGLGWTKGRLSVALRVAREQICPHLGLAIPHPTPATGWKLQLTDQWEPVEEGTAYALGIVERRLGSIFRDVTTIKPKLDPQSIEGRRANFLEKHLGHILRTLSEIHGG